MSPGQWLRSAFLDNLPIKFIAFVLALTVFILVHSDKDQEVSAHVKIAYTMPEDRVLVSERVDQVRVTVKGSWRHIRRFNEDSVDPIRLDLRRFKGGELPLGADLFRIPPGLTIQAISPEALDFEFDALLRREVPLQATLVGKPARGYGVSEAIVRRLGCTYGLNAACRSAVIEGAAREVEDTDMVPTEEVSLAGRSADFEAPVRARLPRDHVWVVGSPDLVVEVTVVEQLTARDLGALKVRPRQAAGGASVESAAVVIEPPEVQVTLRGARLAVEGVDPGAIEPVVGVVQGDATSGRDRKAPVIVEGVPRGVAVEVHPREVTVKSARGAP
jgi:hypothetical protein